MCGSVDFEMVLPDFMIKARREAREKQARQEREMSARADAGARALLGEVVMTARRVREPA